jgi:transcription antitermination factor NusG
MWIPSTEEEIIEAVRNRDLVETPSFDVKRQLPPPGKMSDVVIDIAAMANDGGVLLYGLGEDEGGRPAELHPFPLKGQVERIEQALRTGSDEPPEIHIKEIRTAEDPERGYLLVVVPVSPRAPHQVITNEKEFRFYGRSGRQNVPLSQGEIERLYQRRFAGQVETGSVVHSLRERSPLPSHPDFAQLHLLIHPVVRGQPLLERALGKEDANLFFNELVQEASSVDVFRRPQSQSLDLFLGRWRRLVEGWAPETSLLDHRGDIEREMRQLYKKLELRGDGEVWFFHARAGERLHVGQRVRFDEGIHAEIVTRICALAGGMFDRSSFYGQVRATILVTGLKDAVGVALADGLPNTHLFPEDEYTRSLQLSSIQLVENPKSVAAELIMPLVNALAQSRFDPFRGS